MREITQKELEKIIENHQHWLDRDCDGWESMCANLCGADLKDANLGNADLRYADLSGADLRYTNLRGANLYNINLTYADLRYADLSGADLKDANLSGTNLRCADLKDANLSGTNLRCANLRFVDLRFANLSNADLGCADLSNAVLGCANLYNANLKYIKGSLLEYRKGKILTESIIGYKKCKGDIIVKLEIPRGAIVFSINGEKCRTNKAKVLEIYGANRTISCYKYMSYYVGDEFTVYNFDCMYNNECAPGIHFFMTREEAEKY